MKSLLTIGLGSLLLTASAFAECDVNNVKNACMDTLSGQGDEMLDNDSVYIVVNGSACTYTFHTIASNGNVSTWIGHASTYWDKNEGCKAKDESIVRAEKF